MRSSGAGWGIALPMPSPSCEVSGRTYLLGTYVQIQVRPHPAGGERNRERIGNVSGTILDT
jgi:hypothetical protein